VHHTVGVDTTPQRVAVDAPSSSFEEFVWYRRLQLRPLAVAPAVYYRNPVVAERSFVVGSILDPHTISFSTGSAVRVRRAYKRRWGVGLGAQGIALRHGTATVYCPEGAGIMNVVHDSNTKEEEYI